MIHKCFVVLKQMMFWHRKVGRYLKTMFEGMEDISNKTGQDHRNLGLERLLACKTRREAARMFFETLVISLSLSLSLLFRVV